MDPVRYRTGLLVIAILCGFFAVVAAVIAYHYPSRLLQFIIFVQSVFQGALAVAFAYWWKKLK